MHWFLINNVAHIWLCLEKKFKWDFWLTMGPTIRPKPKNVSSVANVVPTELGNSLAMIAKLDVRKAALPSASTMRIVKARVMNIVWSSTRSRRPNRIAEVPVVNMPQLNMICLDLSGIFKNYFLEFSCTDVMTHLRSNLVQVLPVNWWNHKHDQFEHTEH